MRGSSRTNLYAGGCTEIAWNTDNDKYGRGSELDSNPVQVLLDTGSTLSMVRADCMQSKQLDNQRKASAQCVHGIALSTPPLRFSFRSEIREEKCRWM